MNRIHFIGIGGIGVSALARYYLEKGYEVTGSDLISSEITEDLQGKGAEIFIGEHKEDNIKKGIGLVVYTSATSEGNPEVKKAKELNIKTQSYSQALGELTKEHFTIAVSGTHGKSSTSSMIGLLLTKAGLDPTIIIGTKLKELDNSNCRVGESNYLVIEADEWSASFLNYHPNIIVLTNIEEEHLDFYKDLDHILSTYKKYLENLADDGFLVINKDDENISKLIKEIDIDPSSIKEFSLSSPEAEKIRSAINLPGEHNVANGLATFFVANILNIEEKVILDSIADYKGSWRRFDLSERKVEEKSFVLINDYAHHPTEIRAMLSASREKFPERKIRVVFQPHQYQRTFYLFDDFVRVFSEALIDELIITDIYDVAGREEKEIKENISSEKLAKKIKEKSDLKTNYIPSLEKAADYLKENLEEKEVLIIMGAGTIYKLADYFPLDRKESKKENKITDL